MPNAKAVALLLAIFVYGLSGQTANSRSRRAISPKQTDTGAYKTLAGTFHGTLKELSGKEIVIDNDEHQTVSIRRSRKTKFLKEDREIKGSDISINTAVSIDAAEDIDLKPTAITVTVDTPKKTDAK